MVGQFSGIRTAEEGGLAGWHRGVLWVKLQKMVLLVLGLCTLADCAAQHRVLPDNRAQGLRPTPPSAQTGQSQDPAGLGIANGALQGVDNAGAVPLAKGAPRPAPPAADLAGAGTGWEREPPPAVTDRHFPEGRLRGKGPLYPAGARSRPETADELSAEPRELRFVLRFRSGSERLDADSLATLGRIAALMRHNPTALARVEGHSDSLGPARQNLRLSLRRAEQVRKLLVRDHDLPPQRLHVQGYGHVRPLADNAGARGRAANRRGEVLLGADTPLQGVAEAQPQRQPEGAAASGSGSAPTTASAPLSLVLGAEPALLPAPGPGPAGGASLAEAAAAAQGQCLVLCYHDLDTNGRYSISSQAFTRQVDFLLANGFTFLSLEAFSRCMEQGAFPHKSLLLTFDDGWKSVMKAFAILKERELPFVVFLAMQYAGHPTGRCLSRDNLEELKAYPGTGFGNHSFGHANRLFGRRKGNGPEYLAYIRNDIAKSQAHFQELIGRDTQFFAFPFGHVNEDYQAALQAAGFRYLFTTSPKAFTAAVNPVAIPRIAGERLAPQTIVAQFQDLPQQAQAPQTRFRQAQGPQPPTLQRVALRADSGLSPPRKGRFLSDKTPESSLARPPVRPERPGLPDAGMRQLVQGPQLPHVGWPTLLAARPEQMAGPPGAVWKEFSPLW